MKNYILIAGLSVCFAAAFPASAGETAKTPAAEKASGAAEKPTGGESVRSDDPGSAAAVTDPRSSQLASILAAAHAGDREGRIDHLFEALETSPQDSEIIMKHLSREFVPGSSAAALLPRFDSLWEKYQDSLLIAGYGGGLHAMAGESTNACRLLKKTLDTVTPEKADADPGKYLILVQNYLFHLERCSDFATGRKLIDTALAGCKDPVRRGHLLQTAAEFYRTAAFRQEGFRLPADDWINSERPYRRAYAETLFEIRKTDAALTGSAVAERLAFYLGHRRSDFALALAADIAEKDPVFENRVQYFRVAVESGDIVICEKILDTLLKGKLTQEAADSARIEVRINAGDYTAAEALIARKPNLAVIPAVQQLMYIKNGNAVGVLKAADASYQQGNRSPRVALLYLIAAEKLKDTAALKKARSILDNDALKKADTANSIGYICTVLNTDLDHADRLLSFAVREAPLNAAYLDSLAFLRLRQGKLEEADKLIHKALSLTTPAIGAGIIIEHAGDIALARGRRDEAISRYNYALSLADEDSNLDAAALKAKITGLTAEKK